MVQALPKGLPPWMPVLAGSQVGSVSDMMLGFPENLVPGLVELAVPFQKFGYVDPRPHHILVLKVHLRPDSRLTSRNMDDGLAFAGDLRCRRGSEGLV